MCKFLTIYCSESVAVELTVVVVVVVVSLLLQQELFCNLNGPFQFW